MSKRVFANYLTGCLLLAAVCAHANESRRAVEPDDFFAIREVGAPRISPDGKQVAYPVTVIDREADRRHSDIWLTRWDGTETVRLTSGAASSHSPRWSPDGRYIAFLSAGHLWLIAPDGRQLRQLTELEHGVDEFDWAPDSKRIALASAVPMSGYKEERAGGPIVIDRLRFRRDGERYISRTRSRLHLLELDDGSITQLTDGPHDELMPSFSPDGRRIAYVTKTGDDPDLHDNWDIFTIEPRAGAAPGLVSKSDFMECDPVWGWQWGGPSWSPDGSSIACIQSGDLRYSWFSLQQLAVFSATGSHGDRPTAWLDRNTTQARFSGDGKRLFFHLEDDLTVQLASIGIDGQDLKRLTPPDRTVFDYDLGPGDRVAVLIGASDQPAEIAVIENGSLRALTQANSELLAAVKMSRAEPVRYRAADGMEISGLLMKPPGYRDGSTYPTILRLHGGPQSQWQHEFDFTWQALAAAGYVVFGPNPRGGSGRGESFQMLAFGEGGFADVPDVLAAADYLVANGIADETQLGVGGYSYGSILTNYVIASDTRFRAATSGAGISNMLAGYGTDEWVRDWELELGPPWENADKWLRASYPFLHADRIKTPTLFINGADDYNVPAIHAEQMYTALKRLGIPTRLIIYPGQDHSLSQPSHARDVIGRYLSWYGQWLRPIASEIPIDLRVMSFNIEWGGTNISFDKVLEAIRKSKADVVGIQEPVGNLRRLATELGWYHDERSYTISKFPLLAAPGANGAYVLVEVRPGKVVALANVHLPSDPDGVGMVRDGASPDAVLEIERATRLPMLLPYLTRLEPLIAANVPVFLSGDFNAPSHADWTPDMVSARPFLRYPLAWPTSMAAAAIGLKDSWREVHPDPQTHPGLTWWARRPPLAAYSPGANDPEERIDFLWFAGAVEVISSEIVGEKDAPEVSIAVDPWPSDHRGVVSQFRVLPVDAPALVATRQRIYRSGEPVELVYRQADRARIRVADVDATVSGNGEILVPADRLPAGHYTVTMSRPAATPIRHEFWVLDKGAVASVAVVGDKFRTGDSIDVSWRNAPGYRFDYLSVIEPGRASDYDGGAAWLYIDALPDGSVTMDDSTVDSGWPLPPGTYVVRLMADDGDRVLAESATFTVYPGE